MCEFQRLAFSEHGYVVRCRECDHYQLGFGTTMLTLSDEDFKMLHYNVLQKHETVCAEAACLQHHSETKSVVITTPFTGMCMVITRKELKHLYNIMEIADNEIQALSMLELFK